MQAPTDIELEPKSIERTYPSARESANILARNIFQWNELRSLSTSPDPSEAANQAASANAAPNNPDEDHEKAIFEKLAGMYMGELFFYIDECLHSMAVGCEVRMCLRECAPRATGKPRYPEELERLLREVRPPFKREGGELVMIVPDKMTVEAHTAMRFEFSSHQQRRRFFSYLVRHVTGRLQSLGYDVAYSARPSITPHAGMADGDLDARILSGDVKVTIRWASDDLADQMERLLYPHQLDAYVGGIDIDDILCGQDQHDEERPTSPTHR